MREHGALNNNTDTAEGFTSLKVLKKWTPSDQNESLMPSNTSVSQNTECQSEKVSSCTQSMMSLEQRFQHDDTFTSYTAQIKKNNNRKSQLEEPVLPEQTFPENEMLTSYSTQITKKKHTSNTEDSVLLEQKLSKHKNHDAQTHSFENQEDISDNSKSNSFTHKTFTSWQPKVIKNSLGVRRTESLNMPRKTREKNEQGLENHKLSSDDITGKSQVIDCNFHKSNSLINKFEKMAQGEEKAKIFGGGKLRRTESARLAPKETPSPLWKNLMKRNTESSVDNDISEKPVEVLRAAPDTQLLFQCNAENDKENPFHKLTAGVTEKPALRETSLTRTSSLKFLSTRKPTELSRSGSLKLPGDDVSICVVYLLDCSVQLSLHYIQEKLVLNELL